MSASLKDKALDFIRSRGGLARQRDFDAIGVQCVILRRLVQEGSLLTPMRGVYQATDMMMFFDEALVLAQLRTGGVVCLCSAADYHGLTDRTQDGIWLAVPQTRANACAAEIETQFDRQLRLTRWRDFSHDDPGIQQVDIDGITVPMTTPERTVVDLLRYRGELPHQDFAKDAFSALVGGKFNQEALLTFAAEYGHQVRVQQLLEAHKTARSAVSRM